MNRVSDIIKRYMKAVSVKNLLFSYSKDEVNINDISFDIEEGKYVSIVGHNGSGKSTLAKLLIGLLTPNQGEIEIFETALNKKTLTEIRRKCGIVFQNPDNQFVGATVEDDLAFGLENRCVESSKMNEIIRKYASLVGMENYLDKEPSNLSGGQKQRVAIAGVLALSPSLLILDEATSMLDPRGRKEIRNLIFKMKEENPSLTIISITHDVEEAYLSDEVIVLNEGKIISKDNPRVVFENKEKILESKLSLPFIIQIKDELKKEGIDLSESLTLESVVDTLCQLK